MTKEQYRKRCEDHKKEINILIDEGIEKALISEAFNISDYGDDYQLYNIVMNAVLRKILKENGLFAEENIETSRKLVKFL